MEKSYSRPGLDDMSVDFLRNRIDWDNDRMVQLGEKRLSLLQELRRLEGQVYGIKRDKNEVSAALKRKLHPGTEQPTQTAHDVVPLRQTLFEMLGDRMLKALDRLPR